MKLLIIIIILLLFELVVQLLVKSIKKKFQWFIEEKDSYPKFDKKKFENYLKNSFDKNLGWTRKANSSGYDSSGGKKIKFNIDHDGSRKSKFKNKIAKYASFGDSYVFCKEVKDKYTWQENISKNKPFYILNYGLGNYGLDQAIIKYANTKLNKSVKFIIIGIVPETICRIQSQWKHFLEFGNINGFKSKFYLKNNKLYLRKNPINKKTNIRSLKKVVKEIAKTDRFYLERFKKKLFKFPYLYSYIRNLNYNLKITYIYFFRKKDQSNLFMYEVMKNNILEAHELYKEKYSKKLFVELIKKFKNIALSRNHIPLLIIMPQYLDLKFKVSNLKYQKFFKNELSKEIRLLDLTNLMEKNLKKKFFTNKFYGSHLSVEGNKFISDNIYKFLIKEN